MGFDFLSCSSVADLDFDVSRTCSPESHAPLTLVLVYLTVIEQNYCSDSCLNASVTLGEVISIFPLCYFAGPDRNAIECNS
jgi:hypothetical protein